MESKQTKLERFIIRAVNEALASIALEKPDTAQWLFQNHASIEFRVAYRMCYDNYRFKELKDIMAWKKGPKAE